MRDLKFRNGDTMPALGLGTWLSQPNEVYDAVLEAIRLGYRHIDCAYIYKNEQEIGKALKFAISEGMVTREELFVTSKLWNSDHAPEDVEPAIIRSLEALQLDYLDLYLMHWPIAFKPGIEHAKTAQDLLSLDELPVEFTWKALEGICEKGLARHIGVSNFNIPKLTRLLAASRIRPEVNQVELHPYLHQNELVEFCNENDIILTAYSPLGSRHLMNESVSIAKADIVLAIAEKHHCLPTQVLLAWGMKRGTSVIPKSTNSTRLRDNYESVFVTLDDEDMIALQSLDRNHRQAKGLYAVLQGGSYSLESIWEM